MPRTVYRVASSITRFEPIQFYVYSTLKNKVLSNNPSNEDDLKGTIQSKVLSISPAKLENAIRNMFVKLHMSARQRNLFPHNISNYRPISLLPTFAKIFEKAMYSRLSQYLQTNYTLGPEQYAFRNGKSTEDAAFRLTDSVLKSLNQKLYVGRIFCDLSKAFDCVNHEILLTKLHFYGIQGITIDWFRSYLTNRKQKVEIKSPNSTHNLLSDWGILKHGVPHGSILGPILFLVYIMTFHCK